MRDGCRVQGTRAGHQAGHGRGYRPAKGSSQGPTRKTTWSTLEFFSYRASRAAAVIVPAEGAMYPLHAVVFSYVIETVLSCSIFLARYQFGEVASPIR